MLQDKGQRKSLKFERYCVLPTDCYSQQGCTTDLFWQRDISHGTAKLGSMTTNSGWSSNFSHEETRGVGGRQAEFSHMSGFSSYSGEEGQMLPKGTMLLSSHYSWEWYLTPKYIHSFLINTQEEHDPESLPISSAFPPGVFPDPSTHQAPCSRVDGGQREICTLHLPHDTGVQPVVWSHCPINSHIGAWGWQYKGLQWEGDGVKPQSQGFGREGLEMREEKKVEMFL